MEAYDVEDLVFAHVRFEGGYVLSVEATWVNDRSDVIVKRFDGWDLRAQLVPLELYTERDGAWCHVPVRARGS
jgi:hypothetical protein